MASPSSLPSLGSKFRDSPQVHVREPLELFRREGNDVLVDGNKGSRTTNNGYETHTQQSGWGCGTVFRNDISDLSGSTGNKQIAFNVTNYSASCPTTVYSGNTATGGEGLTNITVTP